MAAHNRLPPRLHSRACSLKDFGYWTCVPQPTLMIQCPGRGKAKSRLRVRHSPAKSGNRKTDAKLHWFMNIINIIILLSIIMMMNRGSLDAPVPPRVSRCTALDRFTLGSNTCHTSNVVSATHSSSDLTSLEKRGLRNRRECTERRIRSPIAWHVATRPVQWKPGCVT